MCQQNAVRFKKIMVFTMFFTLFVFGSGLTRVIESFKEASSFNRTWKIKKWKGVVEMNFLNDTFPHLHLRSNSTSWGFYKKVDVSLKETPFFIWQWKVKTLPVGADSKIASKDDQAIQVYVSFTSGSITPMNDNLLGYIWDSANPKGTIIVAPKNDKVRYVVLRSKGDSLDTWFKETRNILEDYKLAFKGEPKGEPKAVIFQIDSDDTNSVADSSIAEMRFQSTP